MFGKKLQTLRKKNRIKLIELSKHAGMSNTYLSKFENDWRSVTPELIEKLKAGYRSLGIPDVEKYLESIRLKL